MFIILAIMCVVIFLFCIIYHYFTRKSHCKYYNIHEKEMKCGDDMATEKQCVNTHSALDLARYVINTCNAKNFEITNLKLQKILYFIQANFLVEEGKACFCDEIEAWDFGPVIPSVYREFKCFGSLDIPSIKEYYEFDNTVFEIIKKQYECIFNKREKELIDEILVQCSNILTSSLVSITHNQTPWIEAYSQGKNKIMSTESIKKYFEEQLKSQEV